MARKKLAPGKGRGNAQMLAVLALFRVIFKSVREHYAAVERRAGISGAQLWALAQVAGKPGIEVGELARALAIHQSTASNLLRKLEARGLVSRRRQGADQRAVQLFASAKGAKVLGRAPKPLIGVLQYALSTLPRRDLDRLHRHLTHLAGRMQARRMSAEKTLLSEM